MRPAGARLEQSPSSSRGVRPGSPCLRRAATLAGLAVLGAGAGHQCLAQATDALQSPAGDRLPAWTRNWSPLARVGDLPRTLPGGTVFPSLLTLPAPRVGIFWTAGNPAALPFELEDERVEFRAGGMGMSGDYFRPLDPGRVTSSSVQAFGWRRLGDRGAAIGRFVVSRPSLQDSAFADVLDPYTSNPFLVLDTIGDPVRRLAARLEGATGWRFGRFALGLGLGYEGQETRTTVSPVPRVNRSAIPAVTGGIGYQTADGSFQVGAFARFKQTTQFLQIVTISQASRIFQLEGYEEPVPLDLQPAEFRRRFERNAYAVGGAVGGRSGSATWTVFGQVEEVSEDQFTRTRANAPPKDRWDGNGWTAGGAFQWPLGPDRFLLTLNGRYTTLSGEALRADIDAVVFTVDEDRLTTDLELRLLPVGGWQAAGRFHVVREVRDRRDLLAQASSSIRSWQGGAAVEVARVLSGGFGLSVGGSLALYGPSGLIPRPEDRGPVFRRFVGPELALDVTDAREQAGQLTFRWQTAHQTGLWLRGQVGSLVPTGSSSAPLVPTGRRTGWNVSAGVVLGETWP
ncbi:MAG: DUF6850 family outer membrane beta-barrel protein [Gemmatimonadota bacterium]